MILKHLFSFNFMICNSSFMNSLFKRWENMGLYCIFFVFNVQLFLCLFFNLIRSMWLSLWHLIESHRLCRVPCLHDEGGRLWNSTLTNATYSTIYPHTYDMIDVYKYTTYLCWAIVHALYFLIVVVYDRPLSRASRVWTYPLYVKKLIEIYDYS